MSSMIYDLKIILNLDVIDSYYHSDVKFGLTGSSNDNICVVSKIVRIKIIKNIQRKDKSLFLFTQNCTLDFLFLLYNKQFV